MMRFFGTIWRLHRAGLLTREDWLFLASMAGAWLFLLWLLGMVFLAPVYACWRSPDCWGGM